MSGLFDSDLASGTRYFALRVEPQKKIYTGEMFVLVQQFVTEIVE